MPNESQGRESGWKNNFIIMNSINENYSSQYFEVWVKTILNPGIKKVYYKRFLLLWNRYAWMSTHSPESPYYISNNISKKHK